ncbi:transaldolase [Sulfurospirillum arcachonense]|uniref:transaldolase n=1 Tax=Sulfurospirillum arcachonense TaxID=57666 RepID=UPI00046A1219|nr:transaldolase [Sulfurospirillum arcachonense]
MCRKDINFSLWCDFVERNFLDGEFKDLINNNVVNGATSNPAIFKSAFLTSPAYQEDRARLKTDNAKSIYEKLAIEDIKRAAASMAHLYEKDNDGFISIEVDPFLCDDAKATIEEGKRLYKAIGKNNVMIKVPATKAGYEAMEVLMSDGIHVNATLIFSPDQAKNCVEAFKRATDKYESGVKLPQGVISVFVSRFDGKLDSTLKDLGMQTAKVGIYNATQIYHLIEDYNMPNIRTLFASTGVKSDALEVDYYIKELLFKNSVNTAPLDTIKAFIQSNEIEEIIPNKEYEEFFNNLEKNGVDMEKVYSELLHDGLVSFKDAFKQILDEL